MKQFCSNCGSDGHTLQNCPAPTEDDYEYPNASEVKGEFDTGYILTYGHAAVFTPYGGHGCCNIKLTFGNENEEDDVIEIHNMHFDMAEDLRNALTAWLEAELIGENDDE